MPDPLERFVYPELTFDLHCGADRFVADLTEQFPGEQSAIRRYVRDVRRAARGFNRWGMRRNGSVGGALPRP